MALAEETTSDEKEGRKMALVKRGKKWHTHFFVDGQRFRQSLETSDWREAQSKEKDLITLAKEGKLGSSAREFARLSFGEAADRYLQGRTLELSESSKKKETHLLTRPRKFFAQQTITKITGEQ